MKQLNAGKSDKAQHGYLGYYQSVFNDISDEKINMMEVGVFFGESINMWSDYFNNGIVYGLDHFTGHQGNGKIFENADSYYNEWESGNLNSNIKLFKVDQSKDEELTAFREQCVKNKTEFQIIIDDGSHLMRDQQLTLYNFFPIVTSGGVFVVEDLHSSSAKDYDVKFDEYGNAKNSTRLLLEQIKSGNLDIRNFFIPDDEQWHNIVKSIKTIELVRVKDGSELAFIYKK